MPPLPPSAGYKGDEGRSGAPDPRIGGGRAGRSRRAGALHADSVRRDGGLSLRALYQHPPQLSAGLQGGQALSSGAQPRREARSEEHTSELQSLMRISYAVFCLTKKINTNVIKNKN